MKRSTVELVLVVSALYFALLFIFRGLLPAESSLPAYLLALPLLLVVLVLAGDLSGRASVPTEPKLRVVEGRRLDRRVKQLTQQIEVGARSSKSYYETVVLTKLRDLLVEKVSLETGMERSLVQEILKDQTRGPVLLGSMELYRLLYSGAPAPGPGRVKLLERIAGMVEEWKP